MSARLVEIFLPQSESGRLEEILARHSRRFWRESVPGGEEKYSCIVQQRYTERLLEDLDSAFSRLPTFGAFVLQLEAVLPPVKETAETALQLSGDLSPPTALERFFSRDRLSTDEIYDDIEESLRVRPSFLLMAFLSALIAALGMRSGQVAAVIGAMIIAPLLGPNIGLAVAATLGDAQLGRRAAATLVLGALAALLAGVLVGLTVTIDPTVPELRNRTIVLPADVVLALACGTAGVLAFTRGAALTLVGVMVAIALVPPLAAIGIHAAIGLYEAALGAVYLLSINLVCVNVAGIATLLFQGLPPRSWRMTWSVLAVWLVILFLLMSLVAGRFLFGIGALPRYF